MSKNNRIIKNSVLKAMDFILALYKHFLANLPHAQQAAVEPVELEFKVIQPILRVSPVEFVNCLGQVRRFTHGRQTLFVKVPQLHEVTAALGDFAESVGKSNAQKLLGFFEQLGGGNSDLNDHKAINGLLRAFEEADPSKQKEGIALLRKELALGMVRQAFSQECNEYLDRLYFNPLITGAHRQKVLVSMDFWGQHAASFPKRAKAIGEFLRIYFWEDTVVPDGIRCFLPPDFAGSDRTVVPTATPAEVVPEPQDPSQEPQVEPALDLTDEVVGREDNAVDPDRYDFYMAMGCKKVVRPEGFFGQGGYVAYLLKTASGHKVAFVDSNVRGNAAYVFWAETQATTDSTTWAYHAQHSKQQVRARAGSAGFTYARRFIHIDGWQDRIGDWLQTASPATAILTSNPQVPVAVL